MRVGVKIYLTFKEKGVLPKPKFLALDIDKEKKGFKISA
jgi:hypothetical protein